MYVVTNRVPVANGYHEAFVERFRNRAGQVDKQPGLVSMQVLRPLSAETPFVVQTVWKNEAAFRNWVGSEDFKAAHRNPLPAEAYAGEAKMEQFEVVVTATGTSTP
jgi:heme-degrading monooxygenase HmoA